MSSAISGSNTTSVRSDSDSNVRPGNETDTAVLRYNRVAMLEMVLSIRDRRQDSTQRIVFATVLFLAGALVVAAGFLGWI